MSLDSQTVHGVKHFCVVSFVGFEKRVKIFGTAEEINKIKNRQIAENEKKTNRIAFFMTVGSRTPSFTRIGI